MAGRCWGCNADWRQLWHQTARGTGGRSGLPGASARSRRASASLRSRWLRRPHGGVVRRGRAIQRTEQSVSYSNSGRQPGLRSLHLAVGHAASSAQSSAEKPTPTQGSCLPQESESPRRVLARSPPTVQTGFARAGRRRARTRTQPHLRAGAPHPRSGGRTRSRPGYPALALEVTNPRLSGICGARVDPRPLVPSPPNPEYRAGRWGRACACAQVTRPTHSQSAARGASGAALHFPQASTH